MSTVSLYTLKVNDQYIKGKIKANTRTNANLYHAYKA